MSSQLIDGLLSAAGADCLTRLCLKDSGCCGERVNVDNLYLLLGKGRTDDEYVIRERLQGDRRVHTQDAYVCRRHFCREREMKDANWVPIGVGGGAITGTIREQGEYKRQNKLMPQRKTVVLKL